MAAMNSFIVGLVVTGSFFQFRGVVNSNSLYTLDNAGHGFDDIIAQVVLFTSRRKLIMNVVSSAERLCFHVWLISPGIWWMSFGWRILVQVMERFMGLHTAAVMSARID